MSEVSILEYSQDISQQEAPPPLPANEYLASVEAVEVKTSATSGNDYLAVQMKIARDQFPPDFDANSELYPEGITLTYNRLVIADTANHRYRMRKFCEALGAKMGKQVDPSEWIGLTCKVGIKNSKWEGEDRAEIAKISAA